MRDIISDIASVNVFLFSLLNILNLLRLYIKNTIMLKVISVIVFIFCIVGISIVSYNMISLYNAIAGVIIFGILITLRGKV